GNGPRPRRTSHHEDKPAAVHHTDPERKFAYDRQSHIGRLDKRLDEAVAKGWTIVSMKHEWKIIFPAENQ
ncbi:MAG: hypothetical protein ACXWW4_12420, partial [Candidatus Binatia bacterium]